MAFTFATLRHSARELAQTRLFRRFGIYSLGPNEARILYDCGVSAVALALALVLEALFGRDPVFRSRASWLVIAVPLLTVTYNTALGVYSRLRRSSASKKTVA